MALRDPQSAAIRTVGQARPFFVAYDLSDRRERLVSYHCAQRRYRSAMSFRAALFSLVRRRLPICPHSMACLRSSSDRFTCRLPFSLLVGSEIRIQLQRMRAVTAAFASIPGANLLDWPLGYQDLEPYYA